MLCQETDISITLFPARWYCGLYKDKGSYAKGMTWTIPEHKLDKALAAYRKQEHTFKQRIKKAAIYLSTEGRRSYHPIGHHILSN
mgnify:CR=1 FL=1